MSTRTIALGDAPAIDALRLGAVLLDRTGGTWQVLLVRYADAPTRGWFRMGEATGQIYGSNAVASQGPLRILYDRDLDVPSNIDPCPDCHGTTQDPDTLEHCDRCAGEGWFLPTDDPFTDSPWTRPIALAEAIERAALLRSEEPLQAILPPQSLEAGMSVLAEPKPAYAGSLPRVRGRVLEVQGWGLVGAEGLAHVELMILDDDRTLRPYTASTLKYSFRPIES